MPKRFYRSLKLCVQFAPGAHMSETQCSVFYLKGQIEKSLCDVLHQCEVISRHDV